MLASGLYAAALLVSLPLIPLGLPGLWIQVLASVLLAAATGGALIGWSWVMAFTALAIVAELVEFVSGQWGARRFGGSRRAAWGAFAGGLAGAFIGGVPLPVVGSIVASFIGTFAGAILGEMSAQRSVTPGLRVGVGAVVGRAIGVAAKTAVGLAIAIAGIAVVVVRWTAG